MKLLRKGQAKENKVEKAEGKCKENQSRKAQGIQVEKAFKKSQGEIGRQQEDQNGQG